MKVPTSSREKPKVIWVRSFVPKEKNSAARAILSAVSAARGISIMVPNLYSRNCWVDASTSALILSQIALWKLSSRAEIVTGIMISGIGRRPSFWSSAVAVKMALYWVSAIRG